MNHDAQVITDPQGSVRYQLKVTNYCNAKPAFDKSAYNSKIVEAFKKHRSETMRAQLNSVAICDLGFQEISAQHAARFILQYPFIRASHDLEHVNVNRPENRGYTIRPGNTTSNDLRTFWEKAYFSRPSRWTSEDGRDHYLDDCSLKRFMEEWKYKHKQTRNSLFPTIDTLAGKFMRRTRVSSDGRVFGRPAHVTPHVNDGALRKSCTEDATAYAILKLYKPHRSDCDQNNQPLLGTDKDAPRALREFADNLPIALRNRVLENRDPEDIDTEEEEEVVGAAHSLDETENEVDVEAYLQSINEAIQNMNAHVPTSTFQEYDFDMLSSSTDVTNPGVLLKSPRHVHSASTYITEQETLNKQERQRRMERFNVIYAADNHEDDNHINNGNESFHAQQSEHRDTLVAQLNTKQRAVRDKMYEKLSDDGSSQLLLMVAGTAGCGKSKIIEVIELDCLLKYGYKGQLGPIILSAQTNEAAGLIGGGTCDSLMTLPKNWDQMTNCSKAKWVHSKQASIENVKVIIIDEKSLIGYKLMGKMLQFWRMVDSENADKPFAGRHVIMLGCWYQLDAVADIPLWKPPTRNNPVANHVAGVIDQFEYIELDVNFRFKDDKQWEEIIKKSKYCFKPTAHELDLLNSKVISDDVDAVAKLNEMYDADPSAEKVKLVTATTNNIVHTLNMRCCQDKAVFNVWAQHRPKGEHTNESAEDTYRNQFNLLSYPAKDTTGVNFKGKGIDPKLAPLLQLTVGMRVKLTKTLSTSLNLAKNSCGTIIKFMYGLDPLDNSQNNFVVPNASQHQAAQMQANLLLPTVLVQFDKYTGESFLDETPRVVPITPITLSFTWSNETTHRGDGHQWTRTQLPLYVAEAMTAHKSQGQTCKFHLICPTPVFGRGLWHVQISRIHSLAGVIFLGEITEEHFTRYANAARLIGQAYARLRENTVS